MATPAEVLAAVEHVKECTGDPKAWLTGLTPQEATDAVTIFSASPQRLDNLVARIRQQHPDLFKPATGEMVFPSRTRQGGQRPVDSRRDGPASDHQEGDAADAIRNAEVALAHQNSAAAQLDLQVVTAILNAHQKTAEGRDALDRLQHDIESAVRTRSDLDTPAGARDFQRFLIGKLRDIRAVVVSANLDDSSKSALMAAWTSLYNSANPVDDAGEHRRAPSGPADSAAKSGPAVPEADLDPYADSMLDGDPGLMPEDMSAPIPSASAPAPPMMPSIPPVSGGALPGLAMPSGLPLPGPLPSTDDQRSPKDLDDALLAADDPDDGLSSDQEGDDEADHEPATDEPPASGPTTVTLPNGDTVTAASPQLAEAIKAAAGGMPIPDAFQQQGITIPPPGTAVTDPVDPSRVEPGDIGMFTTRHALALGQSRALLDGQIQHISTVKGPSFLGWEHPPAAVTATAPARSDPPAPTRPATAGTT